MGGAGGGGDEEAHRDECAFSILLLTVIADQNLPTCASGVLSACRYPIRFFSTCS